MQRLLEAAEQGDLESFYTIGAFHDTGDLAPLIPEDKHKASAIFKEAADKGHAHSMWIHACELLWGVGVRDQSIADGSRYLDRAIESGSAAACISKARLLSTGELGFNLDLAEAARLRERAKRLDDSVVDPFV
ncbi:MAG: hypothetical protein QNI99_05015 [Woeseiaceae bacterium]|nr:hypothetical protein [Woeseiaceae bacterium]